jgi:Fe-S cluster biogenesis protein NfuA
LLKFSIAATNFCATVHGVDVLDTQDEATRRRDLDEVMALIAAEVAKDGGRVRLGEVDVVAGVVEVVLAGACGSCSLTGGTLEDGIKRILTQRLDWVRHVNGVVEEDPYARGRGGWVPKREH